MKLYHDDKPFCRWVHVSNSSLCGWALQKIITVNRHEEHLQTYLSDVVRQIFLVLALDFLAIGDVLRWTAMTLMVVPVYRIGMRCHLMNLISSLAMPLLGLSILCGVAPRMCHSRPFSFFPEQRSIDTYFLSELTLSPSEASLNLRGIRQAKENGIIGPQHLKYALGDALYNEHLTALPILLEGGIAEESPEIIHEGVPLNCFAQQYLLPHINLYLITQNGGTPWGNRFKRYFLQQRYASLCQLFRAGVLFSREELETCRTRGQGLIRALRLGLNPSKEDVEQTKRLYDTFIEQTTAEVAVLGKRENPYCWIMVSCLQMNMLRENPDMITLGIRRGYAYTWELCLEILAEVTPQLEATHRSMQAYRVSQLDTVIGKNRIAHPILHIIVDYGIFRSYISEREVPSVPLLLSEAATAHTR